MASHKILLIRLSSLGDIVLTTPAIRAVRAHFPDAYIAMLVAKQSAEILRENPHLDEIITFNRLAKDKDTGEMLRIIRHLRARKFTLTIDLQRKFRTEMLMYFSGAAERIGKGRFCTVRVPEQGNKHATTHYFDLLHAAGIPAEDQKLELFFAESERLAAAQRFDAAGVNKGALTVGLFPGAGWKLREWMPERFAAIGDRLVEHFNANVLIFGGPKEAELVQAVANLMNAHAIPFAGNLQVRELAACLKKCDLFLTNDTGPMHIAAAVGTPTVSLFGPGNHIRFQPLGTLHQTIRHAVPCSPCKQFTDKCKDNICMKGIGVDEVWESVSLALGEYLSTCRFKDA
ncbi:MAG: glycosyltransferase family 9 protein [Candidatus Poribacteria bacterium]|nr:glycosyltransferase family 9 protein [Candidatus Poribacteria bacterium]